MVAFLAAFLAVAFRHPRARHRVLRRHSAPLAGRYAVTLLPIAGGYVIAHYLTLVIQGVVWLPSLLVDPLMGVAPQLDAIPVVVVWYLSVAAIVGGHIAGIVLAHRLALATRPAARPWPACRWSRSWSDTPCCRWGSSPRRSSSTPEPPRPRWHAEPMTEVSIALAFAAGLLSFVSPCVLALLPVYLAFLGDAATTEATDGPRHRDRRSHGRPAPGAPVHRRLQRRVRGARHVDRPPRRSALSDPGGAPGGRHRRDRARRAHHRRLRAGAGSAQRRPRPIAPARRSVGPLPGARRARGGGWQPCIGPVLGAIFTLGASSGSAPVVFLLLVAYSAGLAVPFLAAALALPAFGR